jgi:hypothetical protein
MQIVFGQVSEDRDSEGAFTGVTRDGKEAKFDFKITIEDEQDSQGTFTIEDSLGRYVPLDFSNIDELQELLTTLQRFRNDKQDFSNHWKRIWGY